MVYSNFGPELVAQRRRRLVLLAVVAAVLIVIVLIALFGGHAGQRRAVAAGMLGGLVAVAELVSRYRDDPGAALLSIPAVVYLAVNVGASLGALFLIETFGWTFGSSGSSTPVVQVLTAGFGSAALFRSSLFNITAGDQTIGIGPSTVLNVILNAADRAVDRERGIIRSARAARIMAPVPFAAAEAMLAYVSAAMQNLTDAEAKIVADRIDSLRADRNAGLSDKLKSYILGLELMRFTGPKLLSEAASTMLSSAGPGGEDVPQTGDESSDAAAVLAALTDAGGSLAIRELQQRSSLSFQRAARALDTLESVGQVQRQGRPGEEVVSLVSPRSTGG